MQKKKAFTSAFPHYQSRSICSTYKIITLSERWNSGYKE